MLNTQLQYSLLCLINLVYDTNIKVVLLHQKLIILQQFNHIYFILIYYVTIILEGLISYILRCTCQLSYHYYPINMDGAPILLVVIVCIILLEALQLNISYNEIINQDHDTIALVVLDGNIMLYKQQLSNHFYYAFLDHDSNVNLEFKDNVMQCTQLLYNHKNLLMLGHDTIIQVV